MAVTPQVKAAVDQLLGLWGTSNSKGSHQRVIRDFTDIADSVPVDTTGGTDEQRLEWAMKVLEGGAQAYPFFSKKGAGGWESAAMPLSNAYAPAAKIYSEWVPDYVQFDEGGVPSQGPVDYNRWAQVAPQLGFRGQPFQSAYDYESGATFNGPPSPEFVAFVDQKRAEGYDFVQKRSNIHNYNNYYGFRLPSGEVVAQSKTGDDDDIKSFFTDFVLPAAGAAFTMGGGLNALMGGGAAAAPANALTGAGLGAMEGVGLSGNIINAATGQTVASLPAALTAADIGRGLGDVVGQVSQTPAAGLSAEALDAALAGAGGGAAGGKTALEALGGSLQAGATPGALGSVIGSTGTGAAIAAGAAPTILDQAIDLLKNPAGQAVVGAVGSVAGGVMQANAAEAAANQQAEAARNALQLQRDMFEYQKELLDPYRKRGEAALTRLSGALGLEGPAQAQQMLEMDPGYGFRLGEGMKALERMQSARGSMLSGGAMKAGTEYAQKFASGEYQNAYNRLANIAGLGQTVGGQLGTTAQQFGTSAGNVMGQEANALAAGRIGRGSAYSGAIQGGLNAFQNYFNRQQEEQLFRDIFGRTAVGG